MDRFTITVTEREPADHEDEDAPKGCECDSVSCAPVSGPVVATDPTTGGTERPPISPLSS